ncbi:MAG: class I SAM-dependent methyltransferase [Candidatus Acidiferrales bacterium]
MSPRFFEQAKKTAKRHLKKIIPRPGLTLRRIFYFPAETLDRWLGRADPLTPPRYLRYAWSGWFHADSGELIPFLQQHAALKPHHSVLDVGCGVGSLAVPLACFLDARGRYEGFDIVPEGIAWCQKAIASRYASFHFQLADVANPSYNPAGRSQASDYRFPFSDAVFDVVYLGSVFTHMLPPDLENYTREIARVLRPGGRCAITFFLLNPESLELMRAGRSIFTFVHHSGAYSPLDPAMPEDTVAYQESYVLSVFESVGLEVERPLAYGQWCGRRVDFPYQDFVVAAKPVGSGASASARSDSA